MINANFYSMRSIRDRLNIYYKIWCGHLEQKQIMLMLHKYEMSRRESCRKKLQ